MTVTLEDRKTDAAPAATTAPSMASPYHYARRRTHLVMVGNVGVGGDQPIRVQSMTTTRTEDTEATVAQAERLVRAGCEIVRITAPTVKAARNLGEIKRRLRERGIDVPLVADIHFSPEAALEAAEHVDKVRINPGNYVDSRKFAVREYTDSEYAAELARIEQRFTPLVLKCRARGIAMRIGTNHGSLSDRIVNRYGDTPEGMAESALEFLRICEKHDYRAIIISMKASNPKVMIAAYRLLAARMAALGMTYPFHLGVTEAGNGEDARIKSAIGIGGLLADGIGDTIRVSLAEEPEAEVPVAYALAGRYNELRSAPVKTASLPLPWDPHHYERRASDTSAIGPVTVGGENIVAVLAQAGTDGVAQVLRWAGPGARRLQRPDIVEWPLPDEPAFEELRRLRKRLESARALALLPSGGDIGLPKLALLAAGSDPTLLEHALPLVDGVLFGVNSLAPAAVTDTARPGAADATPGAMLEARVRGLAQRAAAAGKALWLEATAPEDEEPPLHTVDALLAAYDAARQETADVVLTIGAASAERAIHAQRLLAARLAKAGRRPPLFLRSAAEDEPLIPASIALGSLLCDGVGDVVQAHTPAGGQDDVRLTFNVLQAAGSRLSKTDYVACPSCGRTLFDLQSTTERIKANTSHLVGVKIAIMGCVVNGPGEMADADFGYVGGRPGHVNLYVGKTCVERDVPTEIADERLIDLIKSHGRWQEEEPEEPEGPPDDA